MLKGLVMNQLLSGGGKGTGRGSALKVLVSIIAIASVGAGVTWMRERARVKAATSKADYERYKERTAAQNAAVQARNTALMTMEQRAEAERFQRESSLGVTEILADELLLAYETSTTTADERWKGKVLMVSGSADTIGKDALNAPYLAFRHAGTGLAIQARFDRDSASDLLNLSEGQEVRVKCRCDGKVINALLTGCKLMRGPDLLEHDVVRWRSALPVKALQPRARVIATSLRQMPNFGQNESGDGTRNTTTRESWRNDSGHRGGRGNLN
jgi:hypothetical protein